MYQYNARVVRWIDGDTVVLFVDQGYHNWTEQHHRLVSVGCPELSTPEGKAAAARVNVLAPAGSMVVVDTEKIVQMIPGQLGRTFIRWLCAIRLSDGRDLSTVLLAEGHATPYKRK